MSENGSYPVDTQLALIRRDISEINRALHGNGKALPREGARQNRHT
jgi:hypothetical protein